MPTLPSISVIIPMHNAEPFIEETLDSVFRQTLRPDEIIVVNDGSTDRSHEIVSGIQGVRLIDQPHMNKGCAMNHGINASQGECLAFLDADDLWLPDKLEKQARCLLADPSMDLIFGMARNFRMQRNEETGIQERLYEPGMYAGISSVALFCRRTVFDAVGPFLTVEAKHCFLDWYGRAKDLGLKVSILPDLVFERRIHDSNYGKRMKESQRAAYLISLKEMLDRRRAAPER